MSTFSGLGTALSSLNAQRAALEVSGQNIANANTVGYTRQRANISSIPTQMAPAMFSTPTVAGNGVRVDGVTRIGDIFLDTRVRTQTATAGYQQVRAEAYTRLESGFGEPGKSALSSKMDAMWGAWHDVANTPDLASARQVLIEGSRAVVSSVRSLYDGVATQWENTRTQTTAMVDQVNTAAAGIADLNARIVSITNAGGNANEVIDKRDQLITSLSDMVGATARIKADGSADVMVGGNALVSGARANEVTLSGPTSFAEAMGGGDLALVWKDNAAIPLSMSGGRVAGNLTVLAAPDATGTGGILTEAAKQIDAIALTLAETVNLLHGQAVDLDGNPAGDFFSFDPSQPASSLQVRLSDPRDVGAAAAANGPLDGSIADALGQLRSSTDGPNAQWNATVVQLGVRTASAGESAKVAEIARASAESLQLSNSSVDTDEETVNMLAYQRAYQGAARVLTAIDEMLDTLINRTGVVGR